MRKHASNVRSPLDGVVRNQYARNIAEEGHNTLRQNHIMQKHEAEDIFEGVCKDPQKWLDQANKLKMSADVIEVALQDIIARKYTEQGLDLELGGYLKSFMLLVGMAIENLIKGILIGRDPSIVNRDFISKNLLPRGGHGISTGAKKFIDSSNAEEELLRRLEEYLVWAGRYPMPLKSEVYLSSQTPENIFGISWTDFELIDKLYDRLAEILDDEWSARKVSV